MKEEWMEKLDLYYSQWHVRFRCWAAKQHVMMSGAVVSWNPRSHSSPSSRASFLFSAGEEVRCSSVCEASTSFWPSKSPSSTTLVSCVPPLVCCPILCMNAWFQRSHAQQHVELQVFRLKSNFQQVLLKDLLLKKISAEQAVKYSLWWCTLKASVKDMNSFTRTKIHHHLTFVSFMTILNL